MRRALLVALACVAAACSDEPAAPRLQGSALDSRPNVLLIVTDDQALQTVSVMPRTRALLGETGVTFTNAFAPTSLCCPARATILRGQYAHNHGVLFNGGTWGGVAAARAGKIEKSTIATWLRSAGYATGFFGKYMNGYDVRDRVPPGWDEWQVPVTGTRVDYWVTQMNANGVAVAVNGEHHTDLVAQLSREWIARQAGPWFAAVFFKAPHAPREPPLRHAGLFESAVLPEPPSFNVPNPVGTNRTDTMGWRYAETVLEGYRGQLELLQAVDEAVEAYVTQLQQTGQYGNTIIIYTSDNGWLFGEHALRGKNRPYEESIRVPFIVRGPGIHQGVARPHLAIQTDIAPTIAEFAGVAVPAWVDGSSLAPILTGQVTLSSWRSRFLFEHWERDFFQSAGVRTRKTSYIDWYTGERELYDLVADPFQLTNLITGPDNHNNYRTWLAALRRCSGASCRAAERN